MEYIQTKRNSKTHLLGGGDCSWGRVYLLSTHIHMIEKGVILKVGAEPTFFFRRPTFLVRIYTTTYCEILLGRRYENARRADTKTQRPPIYIKHQGAFFGTAPTFSSTKSLGIIPVT